MAAAIWDNQEKPQAMGGGWDYEENNLTYDEDIDPDTNLSTKYNGFGEAQVWNNQTKS